MPFMVDESDASFPQPVLRVVDLKTFSLRTGFRYVDSHTGEAHDVPPHGENETTDLVSVPSLLWGLIAPYGHQLLPALLHDHWCARARAAAPDERAAVRAKGDLLFRRGLRERGVPWSRRWLMWAAVSIEGYSRFALASFLGTVALALSGFGWLGVAFCRLDGWATAGALLAPAAAGFLERRHLAVAALGTYGVPVAAVAAVGVLLAGGVIWLVPSGAVWLLRWSVTLLSFRKIPPPGRPPIFGPTALRRGGP